MSSAKARPRLEQHAVGTASAAARTQAAAIYAALFSDTVPAQVAERYEAALAVLPLDSQPERLDALWAHPRALAAVEYFLRLTRGKNGLSQRFQVLFYLAEIEPELFPRFVRCRASWLGGLVDLARVGLSAPLYFGRGFCWWRPSPRWWRPSRRA